MTTTEKLKQFHYTMTHDEFGNNDLANNYYLLFALMLGYCLLVVAGGIGWILYLLK